MKSMIPPISWESVRDDILSLGEELFELEAIGLVGSLIWGGFNEETSDIDVFIILPDLPTDEHRGMEERWDRRLRRFLYDKYRRDVTVLGYSLRALRKVPVWHTLVMVSDGLLIWDKGKVARIFRRIVEEAQKQGLERVCGKKHPIWRIKPPVKPGTIVRVEIPDEEEI
jgi:predicted nucleotidyltransferase